MFSTFETLYIINMRFKRAGQQLSQELVSCLLVSQIQVDSELDQGEKKKPENNKELAYEWEFLIFSSMAMLPRRVRRAWEICCFVK